MSVSETTNLVEVAQAKSQTPLILKGCLRKFDAEKSISFKSKYKYFVLILTFFIYASYHLTRKPLSVVKSEMNPCDGKNASNCTGGWEPFNGPNSKAYFGLLDSTYLFAYALGMFICGHIAERSNLRHFLFVGMVLSGVTTAMFGLGKYWDIHNIYYFAVLQSFAGLFQATGWPPVVACVANWFGKGSRGFIMGVWNSHTSVGNILGSLLAGAFVSSNWALSFIIPGLEIIILGVIVLFFLIPDPTDVDNETGYKTVPDVEESERDEEILSNGNIQNNGTTEVILESPDSEVKAISFWRALMIPGVIEFSLCLFFAKLVSYTFLFWLPYYISKSGHFSSSTSAILSTLFDIGGILGGIAAGAASDLTNAGALTCMIMLLLAAPFMFMYYFLGHYSLAVNMTLLTVVGFFVNGPYSLITTAISADLGTHPSLKGNSKALSTVTAIIDGTGSIGAAVGPLLTSFLSQYGWDRVFEMLIASDILALLVSSYIHFTVATKARKTSGDSASRLRCRFFRCKLNPYRIRLGISQWLGAMSGILILTLSYLCLTSGSKSSVLKTKGNFSQA